MDVILRAAAEVLADRGYHATNLEHVAERLDLAKASLYHYFTSKDDLVLACLMTCADRVRDALLEVAALPGEPIERLRRLVTRQIELISKDYPEMSRLYLQPLDWPPAIARAIVERRAEHDAIFRSAVDQAVKAGQVDRATATVARQLLHGALNSVPSWTRGNLNGRSRSLVVETAMRLFGSGIESAPR